MIDQHKNKPHQWIGAAGTALLAVAAGWLLSTWAGLGWAHEGIEHGAKTSKAAVAAGNAETRAIPSDDLGNASPEYFEFASIQKNCVRTRFTPFGKAEKWKSCKLESHGFVGTIEVPGQGLQDFYYAMYCLSKSSRRCDRQALLVFSNRAYRPEAVLRLARLDPAGTRYQVPLLIGTDIENALAITATTPAGEVTGRQYFGWINSRWVMVNPSGWQEQLRPRLPHGWSVKVAQGDMPDPETMAMRVSMHRDDVKACCEETRVAEIKFELAMGKLVISSVQTLGAAD